MPTTRYQADNGEVHPIRLSADKIAAAGAPPAPPVTSNIYAKVSKTDGEFGLRPRGVNLSREVTSGALTRTFYAFLPVLTPTAYAGTGFNPQAPIEIDGVTWQVVSRRPEDY